MAPPVAEAGHQSYGVENRTLGVEYFARNLQRQREGRGSYAGKRDEIDRALEAAHQLETRQKQVELFLFDRYEIGDANARNPKMLAHFDPNKDKFTKFDRDFATSRVVELLGSNDQEDDANESEMLNYNISRRQLRKRYQEGNDIFDHDPKLQQEYGYDVQKGSDDPDNVIARRKFIYDYVKNNILLMRSNVLSVHVKKFERSHEIPDEKDFTPDLLEFVNDPQNYEDLVKYHHSDAASPEHNQLKAKLLPALIEQCHLQQIPPQDVEKLLTDVARTLALSDYSLHLWDLSHETALDKVQKGEDQKMSDDDWFTALEKEADEKNKHALKGGVEAFTPVAFSASELQSPPAQIDTPYDAFRVAGVSSVDAYDKETGLYSVTFAVPTGGDVHAQVKIEGGEYVFYNKELNQAGEVKLNQQNLRSGCSALVLDLKVTHEVMLRRGVKLDDYNSSFSNADIRAFCVRLFGRSLDTAPLAEKELHLFEKVMAVVANPVEAGDRRYGVLDSLPARLNKAKEAMSIQEYATQIAGQFSDDKKAFDPNKPSLMTLPDLLDLVRYPKEVPTAGADGAGANIDKDKK